MGYSGGPERRDLVLRATDQSVPLRPGPLRLSDLRETIGRSGPGGESDEQDPDVAEPSAPAAETGGAGEDKGVHQLSAAALGALAKSLRGVHGPPEHREGGESEPTAVCLFPAGVAEMNIITV